MSASFDAPQFNDPVYKKILGLEETESIDDWYTLLGLEKFESDNAAILKAVEQRFERARRYKVGKYEVQSQRLIDELGRARECLTNEQERRRYNETLAGPPGDAFTDAIESILLNDPAFDPDDNSRPSSNEPAAEPQSVEGASFYQNLGAGAIEPDADGEQETRQTRHKLDMASELRKLASSQPGRTITDWADRFTFRIPDWRGVDGTSILPTLLLLILLIGGMVALVRGKHRADMERAQTVESQVEELQAEAAGLRLTPATSGAIASGEQDWKEGKEALQANRPLEARKSLESAAQHYSKAIDAEKRRVRR